MLTTTVDGLWALQALTGIEVLSPELGLRPLLPRTEPPELALAHPVAAELVTAGVIDASGTVTGAVLDWLTVIARRDIALLFRVQTPAAGSTAVLLARYARWWAVLSRSRTTIQLCGAGEATDPAAGDAIVAGQLDRVCGPARPAALRPVTLPADALAAPDPAMLRANLIGTGADADQLRLLLLAADPHRSAQASIVAVQAGVDTGSADRQRAGVAVTIIDTPAGRLLAEQIDVEGRRWVIVSPGTRRAVEPAVDRLLNRLPAGENWRTYRKAV